MKKISVFLVISIFITVFSYGQEKKVSEINLKTSAHCMNCKNKIEKTIAFEKGVSFVELDLKTKIVKIKFKTKKNSKENLIKVIKDIGFEASAIKTHSCKHKTEHKDCKHKTKHKDCKHKTEHKDCKH